MFNRINTIAATPPQEFERLPEMIAVRLLRPLIAWSIGRQRHRGQASPTPPPGTGLGAQLVAACGASPIAGVLAGTLQGMWASTVLDRRSLLLICAVLAHGLGCRPLEQEVVPLLLAEGAPESLLPQVLAHLDAPQLTPLQRRLVGFARETIWYEPARLQRLARELRAELSAEQFTEALGLMAMANALCRLDLALQLADG